MSHQENPLLIITGEKIGLGPLRKDLIDSYQRWINDLRVNRTLALPGMPMTREAEQQWLDRVLTDSTGAYFTIYELESKRPIGNTSLENINTADGTAEFGIVIGEPDTWGKGYGTETSRLMLGYGFDVLGLHNIMLQVYAHNQRGVRAYERAGFRTVGVRRGAKVAGRVRYDVILMDATADDVEPSSLHRTIQQGNPSSAPPEESR